MFKTVDFHHQIVLMWCCSSDAQSFRCLTVIPIAISEFLIGQMLALTYLDFLYEWQHIVLFFHAPDISRYLWSSKCPIPMHFPSSGSTGSDIKYKYNYQYDHVCTCVIIWSPLEWTQSEHVNMSNENNFLTWMLPVRITWLPIALLYDHISQLGSLFRKMYKHHSWLNHDYFPNDTEHNGIQIIQITDNEHWNSIIASLTDMMSVYHKMSLENVGNSKLRADHWVPF